ncbi:odorant receptor 4-like [Diprion similis]|uniref:odorant receptor 4-like n=1 Tax=Diprion similis TaxID=362088 RepID=UPI001EF76F17|nr:odorant receptor 4-like [Diprion similis]
MIHRSFKILKRLNIDTEPLRSAMILITAQMTSMVSGLLGNTLVDGFFFITVLHTTGQFEILSDFIGRTKYDSLDPEHDKTKVKEMIRRHQMLLNVTADIQECYGMITFQQLAISTLYLCFFEYAFIMELQKGGEGRMVALKYALTSLTGLENIFVYCFLGDNLTDQGLALRMAVYNSEWYNTTPSVNLSLSIVMTKALQPIVLSAAKIFPLTLQNFTVIIKSSVSYLSVLRALSVSEV